MTDNRPAFIKASNYANGWYAVFTVNYRGDIERLDFRWHREDTNPLYHGEDKVALGPVLGHEWAVQLARAVVYQDSVTGVLRWNVPSYMPYPYYDKRIVEALVPDPNLTCTKCGEVWQRSEMVMYEGLWFCQDDHADEWLKEHYAKFLKRSTTS